MVFDVRATYGLGHRQVARRLNPTSQALPTVRVKEPTYFSGVGEKERVEMTVIGRGVVSMKPDVSNLRLRLTALGSDPESIRLVLDEKIHNLFTALRNIEGRFEYFPGNIAIVPTSESGLTVEGFQLQGQWDLRVVEKSAQWKKLMNHAFDIQNVVESLDGKMLEAYGSLSPKRKQLGMRRGMPAAFRDALMKARQLAKASGLELNETSYQMEEPHGAHDALHLQGAPGTQGLVLVPGVQQMLGLLFKNMPGSLLTQSLQLSQGGEGRVADPVLGEDRTVALDPSAPPRQLMDYQNITVYSSPLRVTFSATPVTIEEETSGDGQLTPPLELDVKA